MAGLPTFTPQTTHSNTSNRPFRYLVYHQPTNQWITDFSCFDRGPWGLLGDSRFAQMDLCVFCSLFFFFFLGGGSACFFFCFFQCGFLVFVFLV